MIGVQNSSPPAVARSGVRCDVRGVACGDTPHITPHKKRLRSAAGAEESGIKERKGWGLIK